MRGIASQHDGAGWSDAIADGLGSVRGLLDDTQAFVSDVNYNPYGVPDASVDGFGFTGEMTDDNGLVYLRARYYDPNVGVFTSLDPFEGVDSRPMSMNGYSWVEGNVANWVDASGMTCDIPYQAISLVPLLNQNAQRCPTPTSGTPTPGAITHDLVKTQYDLEWLNDLKFCKNGYKNDNLYEIMDQITETYGLQFPQSHYFIAGRIFPRDLQDVPWNWDKLASIGRGAWVIGKALEDNFGLAFSGLGLNVNTTEIMRRLFQGKRLIMFEGRTESYWVADIFASLAFGQGGASAIVPPPGIMSDIYGPSGDTAYFQPNLSNLGLFRTFIHEMGHIIDFALGARYTTDTFNNTYAPSTMFYNHLQSAIPGYGYNTTGVCSNLSGGDWGICLATNGQANSIYLLHTLNDMRPQPQTDYFNAGSNFPLYGGNPPPNHFEDFAATWEEWVLDVTNIYHNGNYSSNITNSPRYDFMTNNLAYIFGQVLQGN